MLNCVIVCCYPLYLVQPQAWFINIPINIYDQYYLKLHKNFINPFCKPSNKILICSEFTASTSWKERAFAKFHVLKISWRNSLSFININSGFLQRLFRNLQKHTSIKCFHFLLYSQKWTSVEVHQPIETKYYASHIFSI